MVHALVWLAAAGGAGQETEERLPVSVSETGPRISPGPDPVPLSMEAPAGHDEDEFVLVPIPSYTPTTGAGIALGAGYLFPIGAPGPQTRSSIVSAAAFYSQSGTWAVGGGAKLHLDEDRWRLTGVGVGGQFVLDFRGLGTESGDQERDITLKLRAVGFHLEGLRRLSGPLFAGLRLRGARVRTRIHDEDRAGPVGRLLESAELDTDIVGAGLHAQWDTRDSSFYPTSGTLSDLLADVFEEELGSDVEYQAYSLAYSRYLSLDPSLVLAFRGYARAAVGDVPFFALSYLGSGPDLRGYSIGSYQDRMLGAVQAELRWRFQARWVAAAFAGMGAVAHDLDEFDREDLLPSLGAGLRFTVAPENKISLRLDVAFGKDDEAFYLSVGEAF